jgi:hypothetical protein
MPGEPSQRVARIDKRELADLPSQWTGDERGQYLRLLLRRRGIDLNRFYRVQYYPHHTCWLVTQDIGPGQPAAGTPATQTDTALYARLVDEFRRTAVTAIARLSGQSPSLSAQGGRYELPPKPQELTPAELAKLIGGYPGDGASVRFDGEGGCQDHFIATNS